MKALRAFLFSKGQDGTWSSTVFRECEPLLDAARRVLAVGPDAAAIHIGFWRPDTEAVAKMAAAFEHLILLSDSALSALPPPTSASALPVAEVDGLSFRVALSGFGYEMADPSDEWGIGKNKAAPSLRRSSDGPFEPSGWVAQLIAVKPDAEAKLKDVGIYDDDSFNEMEEVLDIPDRLALALTRYEILTGNWPNVDTILDNLHACPRWFLKGKLMHLNLTVRMRNVCRAHDLKTIGDLATKGSNGLLRMPNMGRGSTHGLAVLLRDAFVMGDILRVKQWRDAEGAESTNDENVDDDTSVGEPESALRRGSPKRHGTPAPPAMPPSSFVDGVNDAARALSTQRREIWKTRLGFRREFMTLQQIADTVGLTRERVRQIEKSAFKNVRNHPVWECLNWRLIAALESRTSPLMLAGLSAIDPWFDGADGMDITFREVFADLLDKKFSLIPVEGGLAISCLSGAEWERAIEAGKDLMSALTREKITEEYARHHVEALLGERGAELREDLWRVVSANAVWAQAPGGERRLSGYGRSAEALVIAVLEESAEPLHVREIHRMACEQAGASYELIRIHQAAQNIALLYGRGTYGLASHCPLSEEDLALVEAQIDDIVSEGESDRQWHTSEFFEALLERGMDFDGRLTKYIINIALRSSANLVYMRRMVWGLKDAWADSASHRLDVRQAVISVLEAAGQPLTKEEILGRLEEGRGVGEHFQIHPAGNLIRIGAKYWGLADRDVLLPNIGALIEAIERRIEQTQEGVHISEAAALLPGVAEEDAKTLWSIAKSKGMQIDRGQHLFPAGWADSRRVSPSEAIRRTLAALPPEGATLEWVCETVNRLTKRIIPKVLTGHMLASSDEAQFDASSGVWRVAAAADSDDELEIEAQQ